MMAGWPYKRKDHLSSIEECQPLFWSYTCQAFIPITISVKGVNSPSEIKMCCNASFCYLWFEKRPAVIIGIDVVNLIRSGISEILLYPFYFFFSAFSSKNTCN